jgi:hypothetical protein
VIIHSSPTTSDRVENLIIFRLISHMSSTIYLVLVKT